MYTQQAFRTSVLFLSLFCGLMLSSTSSTQAQGPSPFTLSEPVDQSILELIAANSWEQFEWQSAGANVSYQVHFIRADSLLPEIVFPSDNGGTLTTFAVPQSGLAALIDSLSGEQYTLTCDLIWYVEAVSAGDTVLSTPPSQEIPGFRLEIRNRFWSYRGVEFDMSSDPITIDAGENLCFDLVSKIASGSTDEYWDSDGRDITLIVNFCTADVDTSNRSWNADPDGFSWSRLTVGGQEIQPTIPREYTIPRELFTRGRASVCFTSSKAEPSLHLEIRPRLDKLVQYSPKIDIMPRSFDNLLLEVTTHIPDPAAARVYLMRPMQVIVTPRDRFLNTIADSIPVRMSARFPGELLPPPPAYFPSLLDSNIVLAGVSQFFALASSERRLETSSQPQRITIVRQGAPSVLGETTEIYVERHMPNPFVLREPVDDTMLDLRYTPDDSVITLSWQRANPPDPCTGITVNRFDPSTYNDTVRYTVTFYDPTSMKSGAWTVSDGNGLDTTASITVGTMKTILKSFFPFWTGGAASITWFVKASDGLYDILSERVGTKLGNRLRFNFGTLGVTPPSPEGELSLFPGYPNPLKTEGVIPFHLPSRSAATLTLHDMLGRELRTITDGMMEAGLHTVAVNLSGLRSGTYIVRLTAGGQTRTQRLTLIE